MKKILKKALAIVITSCCLACVGCSNKKNTVLTVYMPDGAPAMALAKLMKEDTQKDGVSYFVVNPTTIAARVTNEAQEKNADLCVLPVTAASKLLGNGETYQMLSVVTGGNLCVLSKDESLISAFADGEYKDLSYLLGKTVGVMKINDMPGLTFKWILNHYGLEWRELQNDGEVAADKVNLKGITDATAIDPLDTGVACYVVAEPAASVQVEKKKFTSVCSLETLYYKGEIPMDCTGETFIGYPQAVLVAKRSLIEKDKVWIESFLEEVETSVNWCQTDKASGESIVSAVQSHLEDSGYATTLKAEILKREVIARCGVRFAKSSSCKEAVQTYLQRIASVDTKIGVAQDKFFY